MPNSFSRLGSIKRMGHRILDGFFLILTVLVIVLIAITFSPYHDSYTKNLIREYSHYDDIGLQISNEANSSKPSHHFTLVQLFLPDGSVGKSVNDPLALAAMNYSVPLLWVPGNKGDWTQIFPINGWVNEYLRTSTETNSNQKKRQLLAFSLDFNAWPSALHGDFLENEASAVVLAIKKIQKIFKEKTGREKEKIIILAHSMGGLVALRALTKDSTLFKSAVNAIVFLNAPLLPHPLLSGLSHAFLHRSIMLKVSLNPKDWKLEPLLLSITSGTKDDLVFPELTSFPYPIASRASNAWEISLPSTPNVFDSYSHINILYSTPVTAFLAQLFAILVDNSMSYISRASAVSKIDGLVYLNSHPFQYQPRSRFFQYAPPFLGSSSRNNEFLVKPNPQPSQFNAIDDNNSLWRPCQLYDRSLDLAIVSTATTHDYLSNIQNRTSTLITSALAFKLEDRGSFIELDVLIRGTFESQLLMMSNTSSQLMRLQQHHNKLFEEIDHEDDFDVSVTAPCYSIDQFPSTVGLQFLLCSGSTCSEFMPTSKLTIRYPVALCLWSMGSHPADKFDIPQEILTRVPSSDQQNLSVLRLQGTVVGKTQFAENWTNTNVKVVMTVKISPRRNWSGITLGRVSFRNETTHFEQLTKKLVPVTRLIQEVTTFIRGIYWAHTALIPIKLIPKETSNRPTIDKSTIPNGVSQNVLSEKTVWMSGSNQKLPECIEPLRTVNIPGISLTDIQSYDLTMLPKILVAEPVDNLTTDISQDMPSIVDSLVGWAPLLLAFDKQTSRAYVRRLDLSIPVPTRNNRQKWISPLMQLLRPSRNLFRDSESRVGLFAPRRQIDASLIPLNGEGSDIDIAVIGFPLCRLEAELRHMNTSLNNNYICPQIISRGLDVSPFPWTIHVRGSVISSILGSVRRFYICILGAFVSTLIYSVSKDILPNYVFFFSLKPITWLDRSVTYSRGVLFLTKSFYSILRSHFDCSSGIVVWWITLSAAAWFSQLMWPVVFYAKYNKNETVIKTEFIPLVLYLTLIGMGVSLAVQWVRLCRYLVGQRNAESRFLTEHNVSAFFPREKCFQCNIFRIGCRLLSRIFSYRICRPINYVVTLFLWTISTLRVVVFHIANFWTLSCRDSICSIPFSALPPFCFRSYDSLSLIFLFLLCAQPHLTVALCTLISFICLIFLPGSSFPILGSLLAVATVSVLPFRIPEVLGSIWFLIGGHLILDEKSLVASTNKELREVHANSPTSLPRLIDSIVGHVWDIFINQKSVDAYLIARAITQAVFSSGSVMFCIVVIRDGLKSRQHYALSQKPSEVEIAQPPIITRESEAFGVESAAAVKTTSSDGEEIIASVMASHPSAISTAISSAVSPLQPPVSRVRPIVSDLLPTTESVRVMSSECQVVISRNSSSRFSTRRQMEILDADSGEIELHDCIDTSVLVLILLSQTIGLAGSLLVTFNAVGIWVLPLSCQLLLTTICSTRFLNYFICREVDTSST